MSRIDELSDFDATPIFEGVVITINNSRCYSDRVWKSGAVDNNGGEAAPKTSLVYFTIWSKLTQQQQLQTVYSYIECTVVPRLSMIGQMEMADLWPNIN